MRRDCQPLVGAPPPPLPGLRPLFEAADPEVAPRPGAMDALQRHVGWRALAVDPRPLESEAAVQCGHRRRRQGRDPTRSRDDGPQAARRRGCTPHRDGHAAGAGYAPLERRRARLRAAFERAHVHDCERLPGWTHQPAARRTDQHPHQGRLRRGVPPHLPQQHARPRLLVLPQVPKVVDRAVPSLVRLAVVC